MKRIIEDTEAEGLEALLGEDVLLMCGNYFYTGKLVGVNSTFAKLASPAIVYDTDAGSVLKDTSPMHRDFWYVMLGHIESYGLAK